VVVVGVLRVVDGLNRLLTGLVGLLLAAMAASVFGQVMVRFVLTSLGINISAPWTEELARYLLIWIVFLGAGIGCRKGQLISLEFVVRALPWLPGQVAKHAGCLVCIGFFGLLVSVGMAFVELGRVETSPVMNLSKAWVYWAMPAGASLMILNTAAFMAEAIATRQDIRLMAGAASAE
jgi:TRAP-type C4-dicarboxylate transport system permease small subunit